MFGIFQTRTRSENESNEYSLDQISATPYLAFITANKIDSAISRLIPKDESTGPQIGHTSDIVFT